MTWKEYVVDQAIYILAGRPNTSLVPNVFNYLESDKPIETRQVRGCFERPVQMLPYVWKYRLQNLVNLLGRVELANRKIAAGSGAQNEPI